jgi:hypothetical protein
VLTPPKLMLVLKVPVQVVLAGLAPPRAPRWPLGRKSAPPRVPIRRGPTTPGKGPQEATVFYISEQRGIVGSGTGARAHTFPPLPG